MRTNCVKNVLAVGIILLFIGVAISPVITAVDNDIDDMNDESRGNCEIGTSDDYEEIFTYLDAVGRINWIKRRGIFRGELEIIASEYDCIRLFGFRRSNGSVEKFSEKAVYVHAYRFIGFQTDFKPFVIYGITLGNIDWHPAQEPYDIGV